MPLTRGRLARRSVWFHRSIAVAVMLGVMAATAVVCGALLVGDSMRGSLRELTLERLGTIDGLVIPGQFFSPSRLTREIPAEIKCAPAILFARGVLETNAGPDREQLRRAGNVQIIATDTRFWELQASGLAVPPALPDEQSAILNQAAADELGVLTGDLITVRLPKEQAVPADSPLGRRESESEGLPRLKVVAIIPNRGLGRFSLQPSQIDPPSVYLAIELVQQRLARPGEANLLLLDFPGSPREDEVTKLATLLRPGLDDFGLQLDRVTIPALDLEAPPASADADADAHAVDAEKSDAKPLADYFSLTSKRLVLDAETVAVIRTGFPSDAPQPMLTYLANAVETLDGKRVISYSTITAIDPTPRLPLDFTVKSPATLPPQETAAGETEASAERASAPPIPVAINSWAAAQLEVQPGDLLRIFYYEPETTSGREIERSFIASITSIVPLTEPQTPYRRNRPARFAEPPTIFNDPAFTPTVPGVTDQDSMNDWDLPFQLQREVSRADDAYWNNHRLTPKVFLPLDAGRELFGSRFGDTTSLRFDLAAFAPAPPSQEQLRLQLERALREGQEKIGYRVIPIRQQQLAASRGTTPFDALFLSLSFFVIVAALLLVALLFRLGMEQRAAEYGTLLATGMEGRAVARLALLEGTIIAIPGGLLGVTLGMLYARLVLAALSTWWVGAITVPFLRFHWTTTTLMLGFFSGLVMAILAILTTTRRLRKAATGPLLAGHLPETPGTLRTRRIIRWIPLVGIAGAIALGITAIGFSGPAQAGAFVGGGMLLLAAILSLAYEKLSSWHRARGTLAGPFWRMQTTDQATAQSAALAHRSLGQVDYSLRTMAFRSVGRNPLRSTLSIGLMAVACFLIVSMAAFQLRPTDQGVGGFDLIGQSAVPIFKDLSDPAIRQSMLGKDAEEAKNCQLFPLRFRPGQDASCNNLYLATQPHVLGIPASLVQWYRDGEERVRFQWAATAASPGTGTAGSANPWELLAPLASGTEDDPIPVILDQNTALWSLQMRGGIGEVRGFTFDQRGPRYFRVVALLASSVLQGQLLISDANFQQLFPEISGSSYFLVQAPKGIDSERLAAIFEKRLGDLGMDMVSTRKLLADLLAVQNTYLKTFQSLGGLGLLLGTLGLGVVQLRNVLERRGELALLRAVGFSRARLALTVLLENLTLLLGGIFCGTGAALVAVIPASILGGTSLSLTGPLMMLGLVLVVGMLAGMFAVRRVLKMDLLRALSHP